MFLNVVLLLFFIYIMLVLVFFARCLMLFCCSMGDAVSDVFGHCSKTIRVRFWLDGPYKRLV